MATEWPNVGNINSTQPISGGGNSANQPAVGAPAQSTSAAPALTNGGPLPGATDPSAATLQGSGVAAAPSGALTPPSNAGAPATSQDPSLAAAQSGVPAPGQTLSSLVAPPGATNSSLTSALNSSGNFFAGLFKH